MVGPATATNPAKYEYITIIYVNVELQDTNVKTNRWSGCKRLSPAFYEQTSLHSLRGANRRLAAVRTGCPCSSQRSASASSVRDQSRGGRCCCRTASAPRAPFRDRGTGQCVGAGDLRGHGRRGRNLKIAAPAPSASPSSSRSSANQYEDGITPANADQRQTKSTISAQSGRPLSVSEWLVSSDNSEPSFFDLTEARQIQPIRRRGSR